MFVGVAFVALLGSGACIEKAPIDGAPCDEAHPCPDRWLCAGEVCRRPLTAPVSRCFSDVDCVVGVCLVETGFCVQCTRNDHCVNSACLDVLQCGCREDTQCATRRCHQPTATCLSCFDNSQCATGFCDIETGTCGAKIDESRVEPEEDPDGHLHTTREHA